MISWKLNGYSANANIPKSLTFQMTVGSRGVGYAAFNCAHNCALHRAPGNVSRTLTPRTAPSAVTQNLYQSETRPEPVKKGGKGRPTWGTARAQHAPAKPRADHLFLPRALQTLA